MPRVAWSEFIKHDPAAHLLIAVLPEDEPVKGHRPHLTLMARLLGRLAKGDYALTIDRQQGPAIHCAFASELDAKRIGEALGTRRSSGLPGWRSQRWFRLDEATGETISEAVRAV